MSVRALRDAYATGRTTPRDVIERLLAEVARLESLHVFIALHADDLRAQANRATPSARRLEGVPVVVKDQIDVAGYPTTLGTAHVPPAATRDAAAVGALRAAGAIIAGKTNLHELALGPTGANAHHGAVGNPWDQSLDSGGSSSGSAAAVALGLAPIALGTDLGGSVRIPAALCGVAALKPSAGIVPRAGLVELAPGLEEIGAIGETIDDVRLALGMDAVSPGTFSVGIDETWWTRAEPATARIVAAAIADLDRRPIRVAASIDRALAAGALLTIASVAVAVKRLGLRRDELGPAARLSIALGRSVTSRMLASAVRARDALAGELDAALAKTDVIITPTTDGPARPYSPAALAGDEIDDKRFQARVGFTMPANLAGLPAAQVPCGLDDRGLPIGLQVIGRRGEDARVLAIAARLEHQIAPPRRVRLW